jgi:hypothetical protein
MVEPGPVAADAGVVEDFLEHRLHRADVAADADLAAQLCLQVGRGRQVVGMGVGFQQPVHRQPGLAHVGDDPVGAGVRGTPGLGVVITHAVDDGGAPRDRVRHHVGHGKGGGVEKRLNDGCCHGVEGVS